ncbi:MAG: regulatory protein GemA [Methylotenera sp.]|nr:regulatory protein GemA [Methylotenera sp.]
MKNQDKNTSRTSELAKIHIAKKQLGLDDETYRSMLFTVARVKSSSELDQAGRDAVLAHMKARGWQSKTSAPDVAKAKQALIGKIGALLADMGLSWAYADGIANQMYKRAKLQWCKPAELRGIIVALVNKQKNHPKANNG